MGRGSPRRRLTLNKETLGRLTLTPDELVRVVGGVTATTDTCEDALRGRRYIEGASGSKFCQSGDD